MNEVQRSLADLQAKTWTLAAIASELGLTVSAVEKWKAGVRFPANAKVILMALEALKDRKRVPKRRRYGSESRKRNVGST